MKLSQLLKFDNIIVQCHNNPDADAVASGLALLKYLRGNGKNACLVYSGNFEITKSNLKLMISELEVEIHYVWHQNQMAMLLGLPEGSIPDLLVTVDSQYGESNIKKFEAKKIAIIDHHQISSKLPQLSEVRSYLASCSTLMWRMLKDENYPIDDDIKLSTALYYGLMTDSNNFSELQHPLDMDMRDELRYSTASITRFKNSNISQKELRIAGIALLGSEYYHENHYSIVKTDPCDPNILGIIADMLLEVEDVECCLVYTIHEGGIKLSVRSCVKEVKADELAKYICHGVGDGGGHLVKAGGAITRTLLEKNELIYTPSAIQQFFRQRMESYFTDIEIFYAGKNKMNVSNMNLYKSKRVTVGYIKGADLFPVGTKAVIRAMDGDRELEIRRNTVIVVGVTGEIYATSQERFETNYEPSTKTYKYPGDYAPTIRNHSDGYHGISLLPLLSTATYVGAGNIYARELKKRTKVFTKWNPDCYCLGRPGDYIAVSEDDLSNVYVIEKELFFKTYKPVVD